MALPGRIPSAPNRSPRRQISGAARAVEESRRGRHGAHGARGRPRLPMHAVPLVQRQLVHQRPHPHPQETLARPGLSEEERRNRRRGSFSIMYCILLPFLCFTYLLFFSSFFPLLFLVFSCFTSPSCSPLNPLYTHIFLSFPFLLLLFSPLPLPNHFDPSFVFCHFLPPFLFFHLLLYSFPLPLSSYFLAPFPFLLLLSLLFFSPFLLPPLLFPFSAPSNHFFSFSSSSPSSSFPLSSLPSSFSHLFRFFSQLVPLSRQFSLQFLRPTALNR